MMKIEPSRTPGGLKGGKLSHPVDSGPPGASGTPEVAFPRSLGANTAGGDKYNTAAALKLTPPLQKHQKSPIFVKIHFFYVVPAELRS